MRTGTERLAGAGRHGIVGIAAVIATVGCLHGGRDGGRLRLARVVLGDYACRSVRASGLVAGPSRIVTWLIAAIIAGRAGRMLGQP